jgi:hypothetical protein
MPVTVTGMTTKHQIKDLFTPRTSAFSRARGRDWVALPVVLAGTQT